MRSNLHHTNLKLLLMYATHFTSHLLHLQPLTPPSSSTLLPSLPSPSLLPPSLPATPTHPIMSHLPTAARPYALPPTNHVCSAIPPSRQVDAAQLPTSLDMCVRNLRYSGCCARNPRWWFCWKSGDFASVCGYLCCFFWFFSTFTWWICRSQFSH